VCYLLVVLLLLLIISSRWTILFCYWGEILRPPENSVPQTIVFRNTEIGDKLCGKHRKKCMFLSKYSSDRNNIIASLFRTRSTKVCGRISNTFYTVDFYTVDFYMVKIYTIIFYMVIFYTIAKFIRSFFIRSKFILVKIYTGQNLYGQNLYSV
jgi:hypothetical protein